MVEDTSSAGASWHRRDLELVSELACLLGRLGGSVEQQSAALRTVADAAVGLGATPRCRIVAFEPGRRPTLETAHPGMGSSDGVALVTGSDGSANRTMILFELSEPDRATPDDRWTVSATIGWDDACNGDAIGTVFPGWRDRVLTLHPGRRRQVVELSPDREVPADDLGFADGYLRQAVVQLVAKWDGAPVAADRVRLDVCDARNLGSLYARVIERVIEPDASRQARAAGVPDPGAAYHPWLPVLAIGTDKAALYTRAVVADIVSKTAHLADPSWLLRVGVHLELLTCLGIFEAVRDDIGDVLTPEERAAVEHAPAFRELRDRLNVDAWREVWELRRIAFPRIGVPRAGPVSIANLLNKKRATLAFLHAHHDDLRHAIELAGANHHNAQETWQRVFRDAERAVVRKTGEVFPELEHLPLPMRELLLWQQWGLAGHQGVYPTACTVYRASMNNVAEWAKAERLLDYTGGECIPTRVSLLDAMMHEPARVAILQRGDGYDDTADLMSAGRTTAAEPTATADFEALLGAVPILQLLSEDELQTLATRARPVFAMPGQRLVIQGDQGDSLFVVADGTVEVVLRRDGTDVVIDEMGRGAVFGEMALLTGDPRTATVRARDTAVVFEIVAQDYRPLIRAHPEWLDHLANEMTERLAARERRWPVQHRRAVRGVRKRIVQRFFAVEVPAGVSR
jgi:hypothetical protein